MFSLIVNCIFILSTDVVETNDPDADRAEAKASDCCKSL